MRATLGVLVGVLLFSCGWPGPAAAEEPKTEQASPQKILFLGDSITRAGGYVRMIEAELAKQGSWQVINHGRSSETVSGLSEAYHPGRRPCLLSRIDEELKQTKPDWVVACYGINDGIYHPFNEQRFAAYQAGMEALIKKVHAAGSRLILLTPPPFAHSGPFPEGSDVAAREAIVAKANAEAETSAEKDPNKFGYRTPYPYYDYVLARYARWLLMLGSRQGVWVIDLREPMLLKLKETHGGDPIHPNTAGHAIMAATILKQWPTIQAQAKGIRATDATQRKRRLVFLTNNFSLPALTIALLYKCRWQVELFFKWIKQHLRIKAFYGTSDNAVKTQVWIAISVYLLVAIVKKELRIERSLYEILQVLSLTLFEKTPLFQALQTQMQPHSQPTLHNAA